MKHNAQIVEAFYTAFQRKDYKAMQDLYADSAVFSDSVFKNLNSHQVQSMWEMLIKRSTDLEIKFGKVTSDSSFATAEWTATYTFTSTGHKVVNVIQARFKLKDGKIVEHKDYFPFYTWAKQAFGTTGVLLGWTGYFRKKVQRKALEGLESFMSKKQSS